MERRMRVPLQKSKEGVDFSSEHPDSSSRVFGLHFFSLVSSRVSRFAFRRFNQRFNFDNPSNFHLVQGGFCLHTAGRLGTPGGKTGETREADSFIFTRSPRELGIFKKNVMSFPCV